MPNVLDGAVSQRFLCRYQVSYPILYAESSNPNAKLFNCIQRGHQNSLEQFPMFLALLLSSGVKVNDLQQSETRPTTYMLMILFCLLQYPVPAALFGSLAGWPTSRYDDFVKLCCRYILMADVSDRCSNAVGPFCVCSCKHSSQPTVLLQGYSTGDPKGRLRGNWGHIGELGLLVLVGSTAYSLLLS